jgi:hypothetical protein
MPTVLDPIDSLWNELEYHCSYVLCGLNVLKRVEKVPLTGVTFYPSFYHWMIYRGFQLLWSWWSSKKFGKFQVL